MSEGPTLVYVLPDKIGGVFSIVANLLEHRRPDEFEYRAVLTRNRRDEGGRSNVPLAADSKATVTYTLPDENMYAVVRRLAKAIGAGPGVLVCNDFVELLMASLLDPEKTVVQILHGDYDYYYDLAATHEPLVHAFVAYSRVVFDTLLKRLPHRRDSIFWLPYGIPIADLRREPARADAPLRLIFVGRLDEAKGVRLLPTIDRLLREAAVPVAWTIVGAGPARDALHEAWRDTPDVRWIEDATPADVRLLCAEHDVFVLPTHAEGLSVATMEAMSAGAVPVVSDLASMVELVDGECCGLRVRTGDARAFAAAIETLARDRDRLAAMSAAARRLVVERYDIRSRAAGYQDLFAQWRELYRPRPVAPPRAYGSRLDQPWIPNAVVRLVRSTLRAAR
jgi:glycosyltransferase involved in cell wall biosynthesis